MVNRFEMHFCLLCIFYCQTTHILKTLGQFENWVFVIMSARENIRLIALREHFHFLTEDLHDVNGVFITTTILAYAYGIGVKNQGQIYNALKICQTMSENS